MATVSQLANRSAAAGNGLTAAGGVRSAFLGPMNLVATMQGQRAVRDDLFTVALITWPIIIQMTAHFADFMVFIAKVLHFPNIDTGATFNSIQRDGVFATQGLVSVNIFVETDYSKFLEFGFVHHITGQWIFNPFMIPAADKVAPLFVDAIQQVAGILGGRRSFSAAAASAPGAKAILASARSGLYSFSKFAGDIQVLGVGGLSKFRGFALTGAKGIGNVQAAQAGTLGSRFTRIAAGQLGGRFGRAGIVSGFGGSQLSGPAARIYNRIGGRAFGGALSGIKLPGGF